MRGITWTFEHDEIVKNNYGKMTLKAIGELVGRSEAATSSRAERLGLKSDVFESHRKTDPSNYFEFHFGF